MSLNISKIILGTLQGTKEDKYKREELYNLMIYSFLQLAQFCLNRNDFFSTYILVRAVNHIPISRLEREPFLTKQDGTAIVQE